MYPQKDWSRDRRSKSQAELGDTNTQWKRYGDEEPRTNEGRQRASPAFIQRTSTKQRCLFNGEERRHFSPRTLSFVDASLLLCSSFFAWRPLQNPSMASCFVHCAAAAKPLRHFFISSIKFLRRETLALILFLNFRWFFWVVLIIFWLRNSAWRVIRCKKKKNVCLFDQASSSLNEE